MRPPLLYRLTRSISRVVLSFYFRKLEVAGLENVPAHGPLILAANHPQSVTDALVLGASSPRMVSYLAHSGLFRNRVQAWFLRQLGVIPVYRAEDRADASQRNVEMFAACHDVMRDGGAIGIFPEGTSADEPRVQKLKTGTARIALYGEAEAGWSLGIKIVPVGLNFESRQRFWSRVLLRFGPPIDTHDHKEAFATDAVAAVNTLTARLHQAIRGIVIEIEHAEYEELVGDLEMVYKDELLARAGVEVPGDSRFKRDQWLSRELPRALDYFLEHRPELIWRVRRMLREYRRRLERLRIKDELLRLERGPSIPGAATRFVFWGTLGLPFALYGALWNILPYKLTGRIAERAPDATKIHYYRLVNGAPIYLVYYGTLLYFAFRSLGGSGGTIFALTLAPAGFFARAYARRMAFRRDRIRLGFLELRHGYFVQALRQQRRQLIRELDAAANHYAGAIRLEAATVTYEPSSSTSPGEPGRP